MSTNNLIITLPLVITVIYMTTINLEGNGSLLISETRYTLAIILCTIFGITTLVIWSGAFESHMGGNHSFGGTYILSSLFLGGFIKKARDKRVHKFEPDN